MLTTPRMERQVRRRPTRPSPGALGLLAAVALLTGLLVGDGLFLGRSLDASGRAATTAQRLRQVVSRPPIRGVRGWPHTAQNRAGTYSWDGRTCAARWCVQGFMHNGYASGDVRIVIRVVPETAATVAGRRAATFAGHEAVYRRIGARTEEWIVRIQGTTLAIRLETRPDVSDADLAEAHAIIDSMRVEPRKTKLGFRLVFTLKTDDWDSG